MSRRLRIISAVAADRGCYVACRIPRLAININTSSRAEARCVQWMGELSLSPGRTCGRDCGQSDGLLWAYPSAIWHCCMPLAAWHRCLGAVRRCVVVLRQSESSQSGTPCDKCCAFTTQSSKNTLDQCNAAANAADGVRSETVSACYNPVVDTCLHRCICEGFSCAAVRLHLS